jgi:hypothetical protein
MAVKLMPLALALLGVVIPLVGSGLSALGIALAWLGAIAVFAIARMLLQPTWPVTVFLNLLAIVAIVFFLPEGSVWLIPAVFAQSWVDWWAARRLRSRDIAAC